jgi:hypothetical protein
LEYTISNEYCRPKVVVVDKEKSRVNGAGKADKEKSRLSGTGKADVKPEGEVEERIGRRRNDGFDCKTGEG